MITHFWLVYAPAKSQHAMKEGHVGIENGSNNGGKNDFFERKGVHGPFRMLEIVFLNLQNPTVTLFVPTNPLKCLDCAKHTVHIVQGTFTTSSLQYSVMIREVKMEAGLGVAVQVKWELESR